MTIDFSLASGTGATVATVQKAIEIPREGELILLRHATGTQYHKVIRILRYYDPYLYQTGWHESHVGVVLGDGQCGCH